MHFNLQMHLTEKKLVIALSKHRSTISKHRKIKFMIKLDGRQLATSSFFINDICACDYEAKQNS
jgi:hypothetical protein